MPSTEELLAALGEPAIASITVPATDYPAGSGVPVRVNDNDTLTVLAYVDVSTSMLTDRYLDIQDQLATLEVEKKRIAEQLLERHKPGDVIKLGEDAAIRVEWPRRTFDKNKGLALLSPDDQQDCLVEAIDETRLKAKLKARRLLDDAMTESATAKPFLKVL